MRNFRELKIWSSAISVAKEIYLLTDNFPDREKFGIISQMRRCSVSISSNIAEGCSKSSNKHLIHYLEISLGSAYELETQLILSRELGFIQSENYNLVYPQIDRLQKSINAFRMALFKQGLS